MNLYELAHHPDAWKWERQSQDLCRIAGQVWWYASNSTNEQFNLAAGDNNDISYHTDENEFRMHLLFVYWATTEDADMEGECQ